MKYMNKLLQVEKGEDPASIDDKQYYYLETEWLDDATKLVLLDTRTQKCFKGEISNDIMREVAEQLDLEYNAFMAECRLALCTSIGLPGFTYKIDYNESVFQAFKHDKFETQYLDIPLKPVRDQYELLDAAIKHIDECKAQQRETTNAGFDHAQFQDDFNELKQIIENNKEIETILIKKFAYILKQKEREIEKLQSAYKQLTAKVAAQSRAISAELEDDDDIFLQATQLLTPITSDLQRNSVARKRRQITDSDDEDEVLVHN